MPHGTEVVCTTCRHSTRILRAWKSRLICADAAHCHPCRRVTRAAQDHARVNRRHLYPQGSLTSLTTDWLRQRERKAMPTC